MTCPPADAGAHPDGYRNIQVAVQRRAKPAELFGVTPGDAEQAVWELDCRIAGRGDAYDITGRYVQGPPGGRFIYLSWVASHPKPADGGDPAPVMFRRAKLWLDTAISREVLCAAPAGGTLVGRLGLSDPRGRPLCASVRPPAIEWTVGPAHAG